jgi:hypothetical protein
MVAMSREGTMRVVDKRQALGALAGIPKACNESGRAQRVTSGNKVSTAARGRQSARPRSPRFDRMLSWQLDAALFLEENAGGWFERRLAHCLRRRLEARLPGWVR